MSTFILAQMEHCILNIFCIEYKFSSFLCLKCLCYPAQFSIEYFRHRGPQEAWCKQINPALCVYADCTHNFFLPLSLRFSLCHIISQLRKHTALPHFPNALDGQMPYSSAVLWKAYFRDRKIWIWIRVLSSFSPVTWSKLPHSSEKLFPPL